MADRAEPGPGALTDLFALSPVIPVIVVDELDVAVPLARALVDGGVTILEVTLRTDCALEAISRIAREVPEALVGAGTVCTPDQVTRARDAGAQFLVSPGSTDRLLDAVEQSGLPALPGSSTVSDMLRLMERGFTEMKLFPAVPVGGVALLRSVSGPLPHLRFCPTGGISLESAPEFLALPNVGCVGGSWLTPSALVRARDWPAITELAAESAALR